MGPEKAAHPVQRAMVLAAGLGTRLRPLTEHIPKPLVPVAGRPLLENVIVNLRSAGIREIGINTHHLAAQITEFIDGLDDRGGIRLFHEPVILGTGGAFVNARGFLERGEDFLHHNSDVLTDLDIAALCAAHAGSGAAATLGLVDFPAINTVLCTGSGEIVDILPKGAQAPPGYRLMTYTSIGVFSSGILKLLPETGASSLVSAIKRAASEDPGSVRGFFAGDIYWNTVESLKGYAAAHWDVLIAKRLRLKGLDVPADGVLSCEGARISRKVRLSGFVCAGPRSRIESGADLEDCVLLPEAVAKKGERLRNTVLGPDFRFSMDPPVKVDRPVVRRRGFGPELRFSPLVEQGSDRQFYRLTDGSRCEVLMLSPAGDPDLDRYVSIGRFLYQRRLGAPEILAVDKDDGAVLIEDLGDDTLFLSARHEETGGLLQALYDRVIELLVDIQVRATRDIGDCPAAGGRALDYELLRWETRYFSENLLSRFLGVDPGRIEGLAREFHLLAENAAAHPRTFIHRDFQSQNILMKDGRARIVDFQGARLGPLCYDLASLLKDSYVVLPVALRGALEESCRRGLADGGGPRLSREEFHEQLLIAGLQRNMQALGAFGFLWLVKGKPQFRRFIAPGLAHLESGLAEWNSMSGRPGFPSTLALVQEARATLEEEFRRFKGKEEEI